MLKFHGTPLTPNYIFDEVMTNRNCLIPFPNPQNLKRAISMCDKIIIDNGAFTVWRQGIEVDWNNYYDFIDNIVDDIYIFFIPDVIDGTEEENDNLIQQFLDRYKYQKNGGSQLKKGIPIWHVNESMDRLERLVYQYDYIAIGSAGEYRDLGTKQWHARMNEAMKYICDKDGVPKVKVHMLRCLNPELFTMYPFFSGDSTNLAQNHKRDGHWNIINRIEKYDSPKKYTWRNYYETKSLFD